MTTRRLVAWIAFLAIFAMAARVSMDTDSWWHLRAGQWIVEQGSIPQTDPFSYTRYGAAWQYPGWLVQAPMYWIYRTFGPGGLNLWTALMVTLTFVFIWRTLSGGPFLRAFVIVLAAVASGLYWAARPYLVTFLLAAVCLWILEGYRWQGNARAARRLWWLPLLMVIWANSHGGFAVGFLIWGVYFTWDAGRVIWAALLTRLGSFPLPPSNPGTNRLRRLGLVGAIMLLAVMVNPSGPAMLLYPFKTLGIGALGEYIQEWQPPDFKSIQTQPFIWLLLLSLGVAGASRRRMAFTDFALLAGFAYLALTAARNVALFALVAPMVITRHLAPLGAGLARLFGFSLPDEAPARRGQSILNCAIWLVLLLAVGVKLVSVLPREVNEGAFRQTLPVTAVEYLREHQPPGRLFNSYNWGGYLMWALPEYPVFVDGRTDLYNDALINEWLSVMQARQGWGAILDRWQVGLVLVEPGTPLAAGLERSGWQLLFQDEMAVLYGR